MRKTLLSKKRARLLTLLLLLPLSLLRAQTVVTIDNLTYTLEGDSAIVSGCYNLTFHLVIPATVADNGVTYSVKAIGVRALAHCPFLTTVTLPEGLSSIEDEAFYRCESLKEFIVSENSTSFAVQDGVLFDKEIKKLIAYPIRKEEKEYTIPSTVDTIGASAFEDCALTSVTLPKGLSSIGDYAFYSCESLTSVTLPEGLSSIGDYAFSRCESLKEFIVSKNSASFTVQDGVLFDKEIKKLIAYPIGKEENEYTIPSTVDSIGASAFENCALTSVTLPKGLSSIGDYAFCSCSSLTSVTLPEGLSNIGASAFGWCSSLTSVSFPEGLSSIGEYAFYSCESLTSVSFPEGLSSIGERAFSRCESLKELHVPISTPLEIETTTFYGVPTDSCTLYVPKGSKAAYEAAEGWNRFQYIEEEEIESSGAKEQLDTPVSVAVSRGRIVVMGAPVGTPIAVYSLSGALVAYSAECEIALPQQGVYIVCVGKERFKVIY